MSNPQETNSPLKIKIKEDMKSSMKSGDKKRLGAVKLILAAILDKEVETRKDLVDEHIFEILKKLSKKFEERLKKIEIEIYKVSGKKFNIGSPKQLGEMDT